MTEEFRAFRVLFIPLGLLIVFLVFPARMCSRSATPDAQQQTATQSPATVSASGLQIAGSSAQPAEAKTSTYPEGLDAARIQYLVEIDPQFSTPTLATLPKNFSPSDEVTRVLLKKKYIEKAADGKTAVTRDGALNLNLTEQADSWTFPIRKRAFDKVTYVSRVEDDKYDATITWHWEDTPLGSELHVDDKRIHSAVAQFAGGEHHWALSSWPTPPMDAK